MDIKEIRQSIDEIDKKFLDLLNTRLELSKHVAQYKLCNNKKVRDFKREELLLNSLVNYASSQKYDLKKEYILDIFNTIIKNSVYTQNEIIQQVKSHLSNSTKIAFLGIKGSYSYLASKNYVYRYNSELVEIPCKSFYEIIEKVENGIADYGILPVENNSSGIINEAYDLLYDTKLFITEELIFPVKHSVLVHQSLDIQSTNKLQILCSHPQIIQQCSKFIDTLPDVKIHYFSSSAHAMKFVSEQQSSSYAALGNEESGTIYGLKAIKNNISNYLNNVTRFVVLNKNEHQASSLIQNKIFIIFNIMNQPGALVEVLTIFKNYNINLFKLHSRSIINRPEEEKFYLEFEGHIKNPKIQLVLNESKKYVKCIKYIGCYPTEIINKMTNEIIIG